MLHFAVLQSFENKIACFLKSLVFFFFSFFASFFSLLFFFLYFLDLVCCSLLLLETVESDSLEWLSVVVVVVDFELELELLLDDELDEPGGLGGGKGGAVIVVGLVGVWAILLFNHSLRLSSSFSGVSVILYLVLSSLIGCAS